MRSKIKKHLNSVLSHLYINPLEKCNLRCRICYTKKTDFILTEREIIKFIKRYRKAHSLQTVTFCGGEVFTLPYFTGLVNRLTQPRKVSPCEAGRVIVQIITNGTIDRLSEFTNPNMINLIVSIDGFPHYHDKNRGKGNFDKSMIFLKKAKALGFHTEIFSIVTRQNIRDLDKFEKYIYSEVILNEGEYRTVSSEVKNPIRNSVNGGDPDGTVGMTPIKIGVTYHPRKPPVYLLSHPVSNIRGQTSGFDFLNRKEMIKIMREKRTFPPKELGCYQISLSSDGSIFGCCEGTIPLGKMSDDIKYLFGKLKERIEVWEKNNKLDDCLGCSQSEFMCGIKKYLRVL